MVGTKTVWDSQQLYENLQGILPAKGFIKSLHLHRHLHKGKVLEKYLKYLKYASMLRFSFIWLYFSV